MSMKKVARLDRGPIRGSFSELTLKAIRARGLKAGQIADSAGVDRRNVERWMSGQTGLRADSLDRIGIALGLTVVDGRRSAKAAGKPAPEPIVDTGEINHEI